MLKCLSQTCARLVSYRRDRRVNPSTPVLSQPAPVKRLRSALAEDTSAPAEDTRSGMSQTEWAKPRPRCPRVPAWPLLLAEHVGPEAIPGPTRPCVPLPPCGASLRSCVSPALPCCSRVRAQPSVQRRPCAGVRALRRARARLQSARATRPAFAAPSQRWHRAHRRELPPSADIVRHLAGSVVISSLAPCPLRSPVGASSSPHIQGPASGLARPPRVSTGD